MFQDAQTVANKSPAPLHVCFEPWADVVELAPGHTLRIVAESPHAGRLEVDKHDHSICVYAWPGATVKVYDESDLVIAFDVAVPELPQGMSIKGFVDFMGGLVA